MKSLLLYSTIAVLTVATATTGFAKDSKKKKHKDNDKERTVYVERDGRRYYKDHDGHRHYIDYGGDRWADSRDYRGYGYNSGYGYGYNRDRTRTVYVIERNRPVERVVYVDPDGSYYRWVNGRRSYVSGRVFTSYPSRYYYSDGRPRVSITFPL